MNTNDRNYDIIIAGTGPGGAAIAREMSGAGKKVLLLERGPDPALKGSLLQYILYQATPFKSLLISPELLFMVRGLITGGSSTFYYGTCFPVPFAMLKAHGVDLTREVKEIRRDLPIGPLPDNIMGPRAKLIMNSAREIGLDWKKLDKFVITKNWDPESSFNNYFFGDPKDFKWSARMLVREAQQEGAVLINNARVTRVITEGGTATGIEYIRNMKKHRVSAEKIVIAAGGIGSPLILRESGIPEAGHNFFFDPLITAAGYIDRSTDENEIPMSAGMHFSDEGYVMTDMAVPAALDFIFSAGALRLNRMFSHRNVLRIMIKIRDDLGGSLTGKGIVLKKLTIHDKEKLNSGYLKAKKILENAGAKGIHRTWRLAAHPGGTVKIGDVVDSNLQTKFKNLYVCDCSVIPEPWGLPPTLTILALGKRLAGHLLNKDKKKSRGTPAKAQRTRKK